MFFDVLQWTQVVVYGALTLACALRARHRAARATAWVATMFGLFAVVVFLGILFRSRPQIVANIWVIKGFIAALALCPYMMFRFSARFTGPGRRGEIVAAGSTILIVVWTLLISRFYPPNAHKPLLIVLYGDLFLAQWAGLLLYAAFRMYRAGRAQPPVARIRMRLLGSSAGLFGLSALAQTAIKTTPDDPRTLVIQMVSLLGGVLFFCGIVPPRVLKLALHGHDWESLQRTIGTLVASRRPDAVTSEALAAVVANVGARAAAMVDEYGNVSATLGVTDEEARAVGAEIAMEHDVHDVTSLELARGRLIVWEGRCAPLLGKEELALCGSIGGLAELALERCRVWESQERFIAHAAHELRTPLTTLVGVASTITNNRRRLSPSDQEQLTASFERQAARVKALVDNLLDLAKLEQGRVTTTLEPVSLARAVAGALEAAPAPDGQNVRINVSESIEVSADRARLEQVFVNLLTNAYRYGGSDVSIVATNGGTSTTISVSDNGDGVPDQVLPVLFGAFARGPNANGRGSGLGLAITRGLTEAMAGSVTYRRNEGGGARFDVTLRRAANKTLANAG